MEIPIRVKGPEWKVEESLSLNGRHRLPAKRAGIASRTPESR